ncbi:glycosyltransferase family 2 protein [Streptomyces reniochalinae]|uniref:Glycosyltransferase family 2 protein n=1 Tax=Streptomyces reniochalinae TaxID=2250578 RepID=A0A367EQ94_9ACTN|nr:glycosyltransferase family 2 protein [Streptomyces reniochalinae]RCG20264.1 glycosyltransferase family 2 protein [Streptomyces reniochalinae]
MPKLTVIVPCYNVQEFAEDTLRSLANNAGADTEFLLVDDCSTDATPEILDRWAYRLPGATILRHEQNRGIAQSRNSGIDAARGDYVTFLDGDDWYGPGHLDALVGRIEELGCDFVRTDHVRSTGTTRVVHRAPAPVRETVLRPRDVIAPPQVETMVDYPFVWAGVYRRELFADGALRFDAGLRTAEDRLWTWRLHLRARSFAASGLLGVFYRRGVATSLTQIRDARQLDFIPAHDALLADLAADPEGERFLPKAVRTYCALLAFHLAAVRRYHAPVARRLKKRATTAMRGMPQDVLEETLAGMDHARADMLRRHRAVRKAA